MVETGSWGSSQRLSSTHIPGGGPSEKVKDWRALNWEEPLPRRGGSLAAACPFPAPPPPPPPLETASALWTSSFWPGRKAPGTRIQGCPGQGRCDCVSQTLQNESPCGVAYTGYFRTLLLQTMAKGGGRLFKEEKLSPPGFVYPSKCRRGAWNLGGALGIF